MSTDADRIAALELRVASLEHDLMLLLVERVHSPTRIDVPTAADVARRLLLEAA